MADTPMTVVVTARFVKDAKPLMSDSERNGMRQLVPVLVAGYPVKR